MDKRMMAKINETLRANGRQELSMEDMDQVFGGWNLDQLTETERLYFEKLQDAFVEALFSRKESELKEVKRLLAEFDEEMHKKYDLWAPGKMNRNPPVETTRSWRFSAKWYAIVEDASHNSATAGFGIGLSMGKEIAERMGGKLSVRYEGVIISFVFEL